MKSATASLAGQSTKPPKSILSASEKSPIWSDGIQGASIALIGMLTLVGALNWPGVLTSLSMIKARDCCRSSCLWADLRTPRKVSKVCKYALALGSDFEYARCRAMACSSSSHGFWSSDIRKNEFVKTTRAATNDQVLH